MKRVLCIIDSLNVGGAETFLMKIMRCLSSEYQFDFVVSESNGVYSNEILQRGGKIYEVPPRRKNLFLAFQKIRTIVNENKYENVIKLGDSPITGIDLIAARIGGAKHLSFRSCNALTDLTITEKVANAVVRPILNAFVDKKIAPSRLAAEFTFGKCGARDAHILHNGVDLNIFHYDPDGRESIRNEFGIQNKFVVGHIGRFSKQKNHRFLLKVFREICNIRNDSVLILVGEGDDKELIYSWIKEFDLEDKVLMIGQRFDIPKLLSAMDVFVFPSFYEGMPNTIIEAQATGLPCVIADTITREADITGLVSYLPLEDPEVWSQKAIELNENERRTDTHKQFVENKYEIRAVVEHFLSLVFLEN